MTENAAAHDVAAEEQLAWLVLSQLPNIGSKRCQGLVERFGSAQAALDAPRSTWEEITGRAATKETHLLPEHWEWAETQRRNVQRRGGRLLTMADAQYPALLREIAAPPPVLFVLGDLSLDIPGVAIVGPRKATSYGKTAALQLARGVAAAGFCVVSGMASGVDTAAHEGALQAEGPTIAVLGCGVDVVFPPENVGLYRRIREQGALVSEFPMGARPEAGSFPRRNRLISGLSLGVVVVEAPERSGSLITVAYATEQNRDVFAVPGSVLDGRSRGCHRLLRDGAKLAESAEDVLAELAQWRTDRRISSVLEAKKPVPQLEGSERRVFEQLGGEPYHIDQLAQETDMPAAELLGLLLKLELDGLVAQLPGKQFVRVS